MIKTIFKINDIFYAGAEKVFPLDLYLNTEYYLNISLGIQEKESLAGRIFIVNIQDNKYILDRNFFGEDKIKFKCEGVKPVKFRADDYENMDILCITELYYDFPNFKAKTGFEVWINIQEVNNDLINNLNTNSNKKKVLFDIIDRYLKEDYDGVLKDIGVFAEYIAFELVKKTKSNIPKLRSAINHLINCKITKNAKINYAYLGTLLYPLYYIRNQKLHSNPLINFNESTARTAFSILSEIIRYFSDHKISF